MAAVVEDISELIEQLSRRMQRIEQLTTAPVVMGTNPNPTFTTVTIGQPGDTWLMSGPVSPPVAPLVLTAGGLYDDVWIDASWTAPVDGSGYEYFVEISKKVSGVYQGVEAMRTAGTTIRIPRRMPNQTYGIRVYTINRLGRISAPYPTSGWQDVTTGEDATTPATPADLALFRGSTALVATFTAVTDVDVADGNGQYEVWVDTANTFNTANLRKSLGTATVVPFSDLNAEAAWYAKVRSIDSSGNASTWSATVGPTTAGGVIDSMVVVGLSAAKITVGTMSGDRITVNTLDVSALKTSTLTARDITLGAAGQLKAGNPPTTGLLINDQGLSLYAAGVRVIFLDAVTGSATFKGSISSGSTIDGATITGGTIRTSGTGARVQLAGGGLATYISIYSGDVDESLNGVIQHYMAPGTGASRRPHIDIYPPTIVNDANNKPVLSLSGATRDGLSSTQITLTATTIMNRGQVQVVKGTSGVVYTGAQMILKNDFNYTGSNGPTVLLSFWESIYGLAPMIRIHGASGNEFHFIQEASGSYIGVRASAYAVSSSLASKVGVKKMGGVLNRLSQLRPVTFRRPIPKDGREGPRPESWGHNENKEWAGLVAEELVEVFPEAAYYNHEGKADGIEVSSLATLAVRAIQELNERVVALEGKK